MRKPILFSLMCVCLGCGDDDRTLTDGGGGDVASSDSSTDAPPSDAPSTDAPSIDSSGIDAGPIDCDGVFCGPGEFCFFEGSDCGSASTGACVSAPTMCPDDIESAPVCGCDGNVYANGCEAPFAGVDVDELGRCAVPPDRFGCGASQCSNDQVCIVFTGDRPASECDAAPPACSGSLDCTCVLTGDWCSDVCSTDEDGNVTITCEGF